MDNKKDPLMSRKIAARYTEFSPHTLSTWDSRKTYDLKPQKYRGKAMYRKSVLDQFLESRLIKKSKAYKPNQNN